MSDEKPSEEFIEEVDVEIVGDPDTVVEDNHDVADPIVADDTNDATAAAGPYGVGPFTVREVSLLGAWLVAFVVSFFPVYTFSFTRSASLGQFDGPSVWTSGLDWILTIGVPTVAVFLIVLRRFSPSGIRRVGSLGIDQFASVATSVAAVTWLAIVWNSVATAIAVGGWLTTWVVWVELVAAVAMVVLTVFAPFIPPFSEDFRGRPEEVAHRNARQVLPVAARPRRERPVAVAADMPQDAAADAYATTSAGDAYDTGAFAPVDTGAYAPVDPNTYAPAQDANAFAPEGETGAQPVEEWSSPAYARSGYSEPEPAVSHQPFWALVPVERDVVDEQTGAPLFRIGPTAWALVVADRGSSFLVRHDDGRVGVLFDVSGVTRG